MTSLAEMCASTWCIRDDVITSEVRSPARRRWALRGAAVAVCVVTGPVGAAHADVVAMAPAQRNRTTVDGWLLSVSLAGESINSIPNLAGAQNSREAFVTLSADARIEGGGSNPVTAANVESGYQVGCQVDVSQGLQIGGTGQIGGAISALPMPALGGNGSLGGYAQTNLQPGVISTLTMGSMSLTASSGHLDMQDVHVKVDACGGPVTVRSYATLAVATAVQQTQLSVYGDPMVIR